MKPFLFPQIHHKRRITPKQYKSYKSYKGALRQEFDTLCVYCRTPDALARKGSYGVDHYRPVKLFRHLETAWSNLFYACNACNSLKRDYWPDAALESTHFIPNPCDHVMADHVRYDGVTAVARSVAGQTLIDVLDLNGDDASKHREIINDAVAALSRDLAALTNSVRDFDKAIKATRDPARRAILLAERAGEAARADKIKAHLATLRAA